MKNLVLHNTVNLEKESEVYRYIDSIPEKSIFYDLGACVGGFALYACSKNIVTIAIEVEDKNYTGLINNYNNNKSRLPENHDITFLKIGIADRKGTTMLRIGQDHIGGHHKTLDLDNYSASDHIIGQKMVEVPIDTLDNIIKENNLPQPDYIKVDIDGSELAFILGAKESLKNAKSIIIELFLDSKYYQQIIKELDALGFVEESRGSMIDESGIYNIVFVKK